PSLKYRLIKSVACAKTAGHDSSIATALISSGPLPRVVRQLHFGASVDDTDGASTALLIPFSFSRISGSAASAARRPASIAFSASFRLVVIRVTPDVSG